MRLVPYETKPPSSANNRNWETIGNGCLSCQRNYLFTVIEKERLSVYEQRTHMLLDKACKASLDFAFGACRADDQF